MLISEQFIIPIISASAIILGSLIGALCSWLTTKYCTYKNIEVENKIVEDNRKYEKEDKINKFYENVNIIRLDICTAMFQSIRTLKCFDQKKIINKYPIPINKEYSKMVAALSSEFDLKEMSYIYQLYGIIEVLNEHIKDLSYGDKDGCNLIKKDCELFLKKLYGENYPRILNYDIDKLSYKELYNNEFIKIGYKNTLKKLDEIVCIDKYEESRK
nr:hypothetical protein [Clostridium aestuarii]